MDQEFISQESAIFAVMAVFLFFILKFLPRILLGIPFIDPQQVKTKMDIDEGFLILDVRTEREFTGKIGHVPGAVNLPLSELKGRMAELGEELEPYKNQPVCIMCRSENRSPKAAKLLKAAGFTNLSVMKGGMMSWRRDKLPVEGEAK